MTEPRTAYHAGIWDTLLAVDEAAAAIRTRPDASGIRRQAAVEALEAFAEVYSQGKRYLRPETPLLRL